VDKFIGILIISISTILYALVLPLLKKTNQQLPPFTTIAISMFTLFLLAALSSIFLENGLHIKTSIIKNNLQILITAGAINFIAFWLAILAFKYMTVWQQDMFSLITPIVAGVFAYFLLGEKMSPNLFIGLIIMGTGLYIALK
jgi:drug/metabolite transporter (DMT)-like permease